jgi:preprotein translocase subunit YajC
MGNLLLPLLLVALVVPMFLGRRRQQRVVVETQAFQDSLAVGERVMTTSGLHATLVALTDDTVDLEIAPGVITTWSRLVVKERVSEPSDEFEEYDDSDIDLTQPDLVKQDSKDI